MKVMLRIEKVENHIIVHEYRKKSDKYYLNTIL